MLNPVSFCACPKPLSRFLSSSVLWKKYSDIAKQIFWFTMKCIDKISLFFCFTYTIRNDPGNMNTVIKETPNLFSCLLHLKKHPISLAAYYI